MRRLLCLAGAAVLLVLAPTAVHRAPAATVSETDPRLTRVRVTITTTSDWATVDLAPSKLRALRVLDVSPTAEVKRRTAGLTLVAPTPSTAIVDTVFEVPDEPEITVRVRKGYLGVAQVTIERVDEGVTVAEVTNAVHDANGSLTETTVARGELVGTGLAIPRVDDRRLVLAFYYPWWSDGSFDGGTWFDRPDGPYRTDDPDDVVAMVRQAKAAGIDGFVVSWDSRHHAGAFDLVLRAAEEVGGFTVAPYFELTQFDRRGLLGLGSRLDQGAAVASARELFARATSPAMLHHDGTPVVFVYGMWSVGEATWNDLRGRMADAGLDGFFVGDTAKRTADLDGVHFYNPNRDDYGELVERYQGAMATARLDPVLDPSLDARLWAATVSPGQNDLLVRPLSATIRSRAGGARYEQTWQASTDSRPEWILITSWNEWYEQTHVAPGTTTGTRALRQTEAWAAAFHG